MNCKAFEVIEILFLFAYAELSINIKKIHRLEIFQHKKKFTHSRSMLGCDYVMDCRDIGTVFESLVIESSFLQQSRASSTVILLCSFLKLNI
ncbi:CLUMA_CG015960, isoform A [Clunio marinus]|uniref:CLUMA_CG015960, isoform A n=1 Tax=Clunio marinus TaxID=568069 RepID=A0A1J1ISP9_9DIPT|nr:CLUMA_CG015960, isoform A [Clunio marinus]